MPKTQTKRHNTGSRSKKPVVGKAGKGLSKMYGPLPAWGWAAIALAGWYIYTHVLSDTGSQPGDPGTGGRKGGGGKGGGGGHARKGSRKGRRKKPKNAPKVHGAKVARSPRTGPSRDHGGRGGPRQHHRDHAGHRPRAGRGGRR